MPRAPECTPRGGNFKYATHVAYQEQLQRATFAFGGLTEAACICRRVGPRSCFRRCAPIKLTISSSSHHLLA